MKTHAIALLAALSLAAIASGAHAGHRGHSSGMFGVGPGMNFRNPESMVERMSEHLGLDDAQRQSVQNILEAAKPEFQAFREKLGANREAMRALDTTDPNYSAEINNIATANGALATEGTLLFGRVRGEIHAVLTDEQRDKLAKHKDRMRDSDRRHRGR